MQKKEFIEELKKNLYGLPEEDIKEIIEDYEEHFKIGKKNKRKESEIAKSLGNPIEIAKEAKEELGENYETISLGAIFKGFWKEVEKTSRRVWKSVEKEIPRAKEKIKKIFEEIEKKGKKNKNEKNEKRTAKKKAWRIFLLVALNLFLMLWLMISFYAVIISLFAAGISIMVSGIVGIIVGIFVLINPVEFMVKNLSISSIFAGIGITCLGWLWLIFTVKLGKGLSWLVSRYIKSTSRWAKK